MKAGITSPVIYFADTPSTQGAQSNLHWSFNDTDDYEEYLSVTVLGFLEAAFEPIDARNHFKKINQAAVAFTSLNLVSPIEILNQDEFENKIIAIESGRRIAKGKTYIHTY